MENHNKPTSELPFELLLSEMSAVLDMGKTAPSLERFSARAEDCNEFARGPTRVIAMHRALELRSSINLSPKPTASPRVYCSSSYQSNSKCEDLFA